MPKCNEPRAPFVGSGRKQEGGALATRKQDFNAHASGQGFRHCADQIDMHPSIDGWDNIQEAIEGIVASNGDSFIVIGDGYEDCAEDLAIAFDDAFADPSLSEGGVVIVKAATYCIQSTVTVPNGINIRGETGGTYIIGETADVPMFLFQTGSTKRDIQPSIIPQVQSADQNTLQNISFYDNVDGNVASGLPSMSTAPMLQVQHGANLVVKDCAFVGRAVTGPVTVTDRVIGFTGTTSPGVGTTIHVEGCYIDGVKSGINFDAQQGNLDYLTVTNNRARTFGDGGLGTVEDRFFVSTTECNLNVSENYHLGLNTTWGAEGCIYIKDIVSANPAGLTFSLDGNIGGLDVIAGNFLLDGRTTPADVRASKLSTWGTNFSDSNASLGFVDGALVVTDTNFTIDGRLSKAPQIIDLTDAMYSSGLTITYPWKSNIRLVAGSSLTKTGRITVQFSGTPSDGEELSVSLVQPDDAGVNMTGRVVDLQFTATPSAGDPGFVDALNSDYLSVTPHAGSITTFKFSYNATLNRYIKYAESAAVNGPQSFTYNWSGIEFDKPQKSRRAFKSPWSSVGSSAGNSESSSPVFIQRSSGDFRNGMSAWCEISGGNIYFNSVTPAGGVVKSFLLALGGSPEQMSVREDESSTSCHFMLRTNNMYHFEVDLTGGGYGHVSYVGNLFAGASNAGPVYSDKVLDRFYYGLGSTLESMTGVGGAPSAEFVFPATVTDVARSPDGDLFAIDFSGNYVISQEGLGNAPVWVSSSSVFPPVQAASYDKLNQRWIVIAGDDVYHSTDVSASAWVILTTLPFSTTTLNCKSMGNTLVVTSVLSSNNSYCAFSVDGGANWDIFLGDTGIPADNRQVRGFGYFNGNLIATVTQSAGDPEYLISQENVNGWGPLDMDK